MGRALYYLEKSKLPAEAGPLPAAQASETATRLYLLAEQDPSPELEALGAVRLGARIRELPANLRGRFLQDDGTTPRVLFAGDDPADLL